MTASAPRAGEIMAKLTERQKRFADEYLKDLNATSAARRAGYKDPNFGRQLIAKPNVFAYIQKRIKDREQRTEITQDRVLQELAAVGFAKGTDYASIDGSGRVKLCPTGGLSEAQKSSVIYIKETQAGVELKLADKFRALELLGRHLGLFDKDANGADANGQLEKLLEGVKQNGSRVHREAGGANPDVAEGRTETD